MKTIALLCGLTLAAAAQQPNTLTKEEKGQGWVLLFDGKSYKGWVNPVGKTPPSDAWAIDNGALKSVSKPRVREDLVSEKQYKDFELKWEWKVAPGANSGVKYLIQEFILLVDRLLPKKRFEEQVADAQVKGFPRVKLEPSDHSEEYVVGFEYQMIDATHADALRGGSHVTGSLYDMVTPTDAKPKPAGEWNESRIVRKGNHVEHWLNGAKVVDADLANPEIAKSISRRWSVAPGVEKLLLNRPRQDCPISLQNHNDETWFRSIKIRKL